ncbi:hypothetical protein M413DRAFT_107095 [Hebeloma cylindrosporum]|uniref:Uncharacterized protein n=1 Tax=Hebeloma cylindrosporum TaxID=76867 RepID=A0A0C3CL22_HEBCY|nr:hypothetical protein M413DRAFT_107095 [Hebeloma cylindrosporum h7]
MQSGNSGQNPLGSIRVGTDMIMDVLEREQDRATRDLQMRLHHLRQYTDEYQQLAQRNQAIEASKLRETQHRLSELERRYNELCQAKQADDTLFRVTSAGLQALEKEHNNLHAQLALTIQDRNNLLSERDSSVSSAFFANLEKYGIFVSEQNRLSFRGEWLPLWNEFVASDSQNQVLPPNESLTPSELDVLLKTFVTRIRQDRQTIKSLEDNLQALQQHVHLTQMYEPDPKPTEHEEPLVCNSVFPEENAVHPEIDPLRSQTTSQLKTEPLDDNYPLILGQQYANDGYTSSSFAVYSVSPS